MTWNFDLETWNSAFADLELGTQLLHFMNVSNCDILIPLALILAGGETEGSQDDVVRMKETLGKVAKHGGDNAVGDTNGLIVVAVPTTELLKSELALLGLVSS